MYPNSVYIDTLHLHIIWECLMVWIGDMKITKYYKFIISNLFLFLSFIWLLVNFNLLLISICEMTMNLTLEHLQESKELAHIIWQVHIKPYTRKEIYEEKGRFIWPETEHESRKFLPTNKYFINELI